MVLVAEALNTAVEKIADFVHPDFHIKIGFIKDIAAGAPNVCRYHFFNSCRVYLYPKNQFTILA